MGYRLVASVKLRRIRSSRPTPKLYRQYRLELAYPVLLRFPLMRMMMMMVISDDHDDDVGDDDDGDGDGDDDSD